MSRQGIRGGTTRSFDEAATVIELHKRQASELIESAIWQALKDRGEFHADDLVALDIPADSLNAIGARVNAFVRRGYMVEVGRRKSANPASNGRKSNVYAITDKGRAELDARVGTNPHSGAEHTPKPSPDAKRVSSADKPTVSPSVAGGGGTGAAAPEVLTLPLGDVPQAQTRRASYVDWDLEDVA